MKKLSLITCLIVATLLFSSCSKKDSAPDLPAGKTMKFTLTTTGLAAADDFHVAFAGSDIQGTTNAIFKVNNVTQSNMRAITISNAQLRAGQIIVETVIPLFNVSISASGSSAAAGHSFTFKMEPVVNAAPQPVINKTITTTAYSENFSF